MSKKKKQKNQYYQDIDRADAIDGNIKDLYKYKNHFLEVQVYP